MYVCICKAVTESRIRRCVAQGALTLRDLRNETGLGTGCGKCVPQAYSVLSETLNAGPRHSSNAVAPLEAVAR